MTDAGAIYQQKKETNKNIRAFSYKSMNLKNLWQNIIFEN